MNSWVLDWPGMVAWVLPWQQEQTSPLVHVETRPKLSWPTFVAYRVQIALITVKYCHSWLSLLSWRSQGDHHQEPVSLRQNKPPCLPIACLTLQPLVLLCSQNYRYTLSQIPEGESRARDQLIAGYTPGLPTSSIAQLSDVPRRWSDRLFQFIYLQRGIYV